MGYRQAKSQRRVLEKACGSKDHSFHFPAVRQPLSPNNVTRIGGFLSPPSCPSDLASFGTMEATRKWHFGHRAEISALTFAAPSRPPKVTCLTSSISKSASLGMFFVFVGGTIVLSTNSILVGATVSFVPIGKDVVSACREGVIKFNATRRVMRQTKQSLCLCIVFTKSNFALNS